MLNESPRKKLAIVSSYNELCGNAAYTKALSKALEKHMDVTVVPLNTGLLRRTESEAAQSHIKKICQELKTFDYVNIQFEADLFGTNHHSICSRFIQIADVCKNLVLTMHQIVFPFKYPGIVQIAKNTIKRDFKKTLQSYRKTFFHNSRAALYNKMIGYCKIKKIPIVVHTKRDRDDISFHFNYDLVFDHPLCFHEQSYIDSLAQEYNKDKFCNHFNLPKENTYLGILGFILEHKGYETVLRALSFLPEDHVLIIFGKQHPHSVQLNEPVNQYIKLVMDLILELKLQKRVKFFGINNDDEFLRALLGCDFNLLPYLECNQGGSGIAALSLETNSKSIFSQNKAFLELEKYAPDCFPMFSIGNYLELANLIQNYPRSPHTDGLKKYHQNYNPQTSAALYKKLFEAVKNL